MSAKVMRIPAGDLWFPDAVAVPGETMVVLPAADYDALLARLAEAERLMDVAASQLEAWGRGTVAPKLRAFLKGEGE